MLVPEGLESDRPSAVSGDVQHRSLMPACSVCSAAQRIGLAVGAGVVAVAPAVSSAPVLSIWLS